MSKVTPEGVVKKAVTDLLDAERIPWWRMQSGKVKSQFGGWIQMCAKGTADILAAPNGIAYAGTGFPQKNRERLVINDGYVLVPKFLWIETKAPKGKPTKEQLEFADFVRNRGHYHMFISDVRELQTWLRESRAR